MIEAPYPTEPVLIVDDESEILSAAEIALALAGITNVVTCNESHRVPDLVQSTAYSAVVLDLLMPGMSGEELLPIILKHVPLAPVVIVTSTNDLDTAVELMRNGAFDYLVKPVDSHRLVTSIRRAVDHHEIRKENASLREHILDGELRSPEAFQHILTNDPRMLSIFRYVEAVSSTVLPVLITGETGVGKELVASSVHQASGRSGAFVTVNTAGLDDQLFSDALFGHKKGAYTGAASDRDGMIARAAGGTLFLDEIGDLSAESQVKLLRLVQQREYYPLGSDTVVRTDARFVFATNHSLDELVRKQKFRQDLYYRLWSHRVEIPPLRERRDDIILLANHFLDKAADETGKRRPATPPELQTYLHVYDFPGNVRELEGMVYDAIVRHTSGVLSLEHFATILGERAHVPSAVANGDGLEAASGEELFSSIQRLPHLQETIDALIEEALRRSEGNQTAAAKLLGMTRSALNKRLNR